MKWTTMSGKQRLYMLHPPQPIKRPSKMQDPSETINMQATQILNCACFATELGYVKQLI